MNSFRLMTFLMITTTIVLALEDLLPTRKSEEKLLSIFDDKSNANDESQNENKVMNGFFEPSLTVSDNENEMTTTTTQTNLDINVKNVKVCVSLTPGYVSTRKNLVNYECQSRICSIDSEENLESEDYQFERPIFDWKTELQHLILVNGSCDPSRILCQYRLEVNVGNFFAEMDRTGLNEMKISCHVADFIRTNSHGVHYDSNGPYHRYHYISGQADALIKLFKGNRIHQTCNQTNECGENMVCNPNTVNNEKKDSSYGYCECPHEDIQIKMQSGTDVKFNAYTLVIDNQYDELVCAKKRSLNESCLYDQQCSSMDQNSYCRPIYSLNGFATRSSICDCLFGYVQDHHSRCVSVYSIRPDDSTEKHQLANYRLQKYPTVVPKRVYIWWIIRSKINNSSSNVTSSNHYANRIASSYRFLWQHYSQQRYLTQMLMALILFLPFILLIVSSAYLHYYRRMIGKRQYKPSQPDKSTSRSSLILTDGRHALPPRDFVKPISISPVVLELDSQEKNKKPSSIDKIQLMNDDHLNQFYQTQFHQ